MTEIISGSHRGAGLPSARDTSTAVNAWYGIRFAELEDGKRFGVPLAASAPGKASSLGEVPVFPQRPSRLSRIMGLGKNINQQSEDAFFVNVWAPENADSLPVIFFIHGGAWMTGGGSMEWYDGKALAERGLVVVTVNYRIGPVGHLASDLTTPVSMPLPAEDLLCALRWVNENIAAYGGDPDRVTVSGQSAGAWYAHLLSTSQRAKGLMNKVAHLSMANNPSWTSSKQQNIQREISKVLGGQDLGTVPLDRLLEASAEVASRAKFPLGQVGALWLPVEGNDVSPLLFDPGWSASACHVKEAYFRYTTEETASFFFESEEMLNASPEWVDEYLASLVPEDIPSALPSAGTSGYRVLLAVSSWNQFQRFPLELANAYTKQGIGSRVEVFSEESPMPNLHSAHCFDLPFQFGAREVWSDAPMLDGIDEDTFQKISHQLVGELADFVN